MAISSILVKTFQLSTLAAAIALTGCGGGGNDTIAPKPSGGNGGTGGTGGTTPTNSVNSSVIQLLDANGNATNTISAAGATAKVKITDASGKGISGALVTFEGDGVTFGTTNGSVLTNADGEASISVKPTDATDTGSYQLTATAQYNGSTVTTPAYNFTLQAANTNISNMTLASTSLASGGSTNITLKTIDTTTNTAQNNVAVNFTATCGTFTSNSVTSSNQGNVTTTYKAIDANGNLCEGTQTIIATTASGSSQSVQVSVAAIQASSIVYTTSTPVQLGAKGSGSSSSGQIEFTVYANGVPAANQNVIISKNYAPSDFSFVSLGNTATQTVKSDSTGKVIVQLYPGALPGPVEIKAALANNTSVYALSKNVSVATGRATQNGFSISFSKNVLENEVDGDTAEITARLVDRQGNAVPDGTILSFNTEGGSITPTCSTVRGSCTVTLTTQNPRPAERRISIIAYLEGDKSYTDMNGDNQYTVGIDGLTRNIGDLFRDDNENGLYDAGEFIYRRGVTGATCATSTYRSPNIAGTCDNNLPATLRYEEVVGFADTTPTLEFISSSTTSFTFNMYGYSQRNISMPSGTKVSVEAADKTPNNNKTCNANLVAGNATVPALVDLSNGTVAPSEVYYRIALEGCTVGDQFKLIVTTPSPLVKTNTYTLNVG